MLHAIGSKKELTQLAYYQIVSDLLESNPVQELKLYRHHIMTTRFQHCLNVSYYNYTICKFFRLDAVSAARAGLLHETPSTGCSAKCTNAHAAQCKRSGYHRQAYVAADQTDAAIQGKFCDRFG